VAVAPSPLAVNEELVFMTASYDAGSVMVRVRRTGDAFKAESVFDLKNNEWNSEVHTPIVYKGHMFAVGKKKRGLFTCLGFDGKEVWTSEGKPRSAWAASCWPMACSSFSMATRASCV
jgi:hypothetical protein